MMTTSTFFLVIFIFFYSIQDALPFFRGNLWQKIRCISRLGLEPLPEEGEAEDGSEDLLRATNNGRVGQGQSFLETFFGGKIS